MRRDVTRFHDTRRWLAGSALAVALLAGGASRAEAETAAWPTTRAGELAKGWVEAFDAGEPAMRKFLTEYLAASSLAKKGIDARIETYRTLREQLGTLTLASIVQEDTGLLAVMLTDGKGKEHEFEFEHEADPPQKLTTITGRLQVEGHGH